MPYWVLLQRRELCSVVNNYRVPAWVQLEWHLLYTIFSQPLSNHFLNYLFIHLNIHKYHNHNNTHDVPVPCRTLLQRPHLCGSNWNSKLWRRILLERHHLRHLSAQHLFPQLYQKGRVLRVLLLLQLQPGDLLQRGHLCPQHWADWLRGRLHLEHTSHVVCQIKYEWIYELGGEFSNRTVNYSRIWSTPFSNLSNRLSSQLIPDCDRSLGDIPDNHLADYNLSYCDCALPSEPVLEWSAMRLRADPVPAGLHLEWEYMFSMM